MNQTQEKVDLGQHPGESIDWRHHRHGCPQYRERWFPYSNPDAGEPMYQVFCMRNTPPETWDEQDKCLSSRAECWRLTEARRAARPTNGDDDDGAGVVIPLGSVKRRTAPRAN